ncbi:MAG: hypothetical protein KC457_31610, partial [Myxococcales bacterium]|nr:hypothetical protein [Myxococcales bacterium]
RRRTPDRRRRLRPRRSGPSLEDDGGRRTVGGAFVLDGRAHLSVKLGFWIVAHADVAAEVAALGSFHSPVQLLVRRVDGVKTLVVRVAPLRENVGAALVELRERLRRRYPKLGDPPGGPMSPVLRVEACGLGAMTLSAAGKIRPIISEETTP